MRLSTSEAIEIAKRFGSDESGAFVNGILDNVARESRKLFETANAFGGRAGQREKPGGKAR